MITIDVWPKTGRVKVTRDASPYERELAATVNWLTLMPPAPRSGPPGYVPENTRLGKFVDLGMISGSEGARCTTVRPVGRGPKSGKFER